MAKTRRELGGTTAKPERTTKAKGVVNIPHDPVNEVVMIAAVVTDPDAAAKYLPRIPPDSFFGTGHSLIWSALRAMQREGLSYDPATIQRFGGGAIDPDVIASYLVERPKAPPNLRFHAECIEWDRARIETVRGPVQSFLEAIRDPTTDPGRLQGLARAIGSSFEGVGTKKYLLDTSSLIAKQSAELDARRNGRGVFGYGIESLDFAGPDEDDAGSARLIPGAAPGMITTVVAVSGAGKSTTASQMAVGLANQGRRVLYGAWEVSPERSLEIMAGQSLGWSRSDLSTGQYDDDEKQQLLDEMARLGEFIRFMDLPDHDDDPPSKTARRRTNADALAELRQCVGDSGCDVFIADLFADILVDTDPDDEAKALRTILKMAKTLGVHVILLHQLRFKELERREDTRPTRDALMGSGAWIGKSDTVLAWHRPALSKSVPDNTIQCIVLKQRYGRWPMAIEFDWDPEYGIIENGREIPYDAPGSTGDDFMSTSLVAPVSSRRGGRR